MPSTQSRSTARTSRNVPRRFHRLLPSPLRSRGLARRRLAPGPGQRADEARSAQRPPRPSWSSSYDQAQIALDRGRARTRRAAEANAAAAEARSDEGAGGPHRRARVAAYESSGSHARRRPRRESFNQLSDRVEFLGNIAQDDADLAAKAQVAEQHYRTAAESARRARSPAKQRSSASLAQREGLDPGRDRRAAGADLAAEEGARPAGARSARCSASQPPAAPGGGTRSGSADGGSGGGGRAAPAAAIGWLGGGSGGGGGGGGGTSTATTTSTTTSAPTATSATPGQGRSRGARRVLGAGHALRLGRWPIPHVGMDCSGLTMWSWAQVGVSLPHSSVGTVRRGHRTCRAPTSSPVTSCSSTRRSTTWRSTSVAGR